MNKKFDYLYAWQASIISIFFLTVFAIFIPKIQLNFDLTIVMTISTFLFGIVGAFAISERYSRYNDLRELIAQETASLTFIYRTFNDINNNYSEDIKLAIDKYLIVSMDYEINEYQSKLEDDFKNLEQMVDKGGKYANSAGKVELFSKALDAIKELNDGRKKISFLGSDKIEPIMWIALVSLSCLTVFSTMFMLSGDVLSKLVSIVFCSAIILILLILRDLDNMRWQNESVAIRPFTEVWDAMKVPHYYTKELIDTKRVKVPVGKIYRVGLHKPGDKQIIKFIQPTK